MLISAELGLSSAKSDITAGGARLAELPRLWRRDPLPSSSISFVMTLVMAIACGVAGANVHYNQPTLGIVEAAFPGQSQWSGSCQRQPNSGSPLGFCCWSRWETASGGGVSLVQLAALTLCRRARS